MKNSGIIVAAVVVILSGTQILSADEPNINFDGGNRRAIALEDFKTDLPALPEVRAVPVPEERTTASLKGDILYKLSKRGRQKLEIALEKTQITFNANICSLIADEKTDILYNSGQVIFAKAVNADLYKTVFESGDRKLLALLPATSAPHTLTRQAVPVCEVVDVVVTHYLWKLIDGVYKKVAEDIIKQEKVCHDEAGPDPEQGGSGSTYHSGQGGNSEFDVNKSIK
jgi:hypothetical protein